MMEEGGAEVDDSSLNCWVRKFAPQLDKVFRQRKGLVGKCQAAQLFDIIDHHFPDTSIREVSSSSGGEFDDCPSIYLPLLTRSGQSCGSPMFELQVESFAQYMLIWRCICPWSLLKQ